MAGSGRRLRAEACAGVPVKEAAIIAALDAIEAAAPPCLPVADCNCRTCARYCALWDTLDRLRADDAATEGRRRGGR